MATASGLADLRTSQRRTICRMLMPLADVSTIHAHITRNQIMPMTCFAVVHGKRRFGHLCERDGGFPDVMLHFVFFVVLTTPLLETKDPEGAQSQIDLTDSVAISIQVAWILLYGFSRAPPYNPPNSHHQPCQIASHRLTTFTVA